MVRRSHRMGSAIAAVVDVHTHYIPQALIEMIVTGEGPTGLKVEQREGKEPLIVHDNGLRYPGPTASRDTAARPPYMTGHGTTVASTPIPPRSISTGSIRAGTTRRAAP